MEHEFRLPARVSELRSSFRIARKRAFSPPVCCRTLEQLALKDHIIEKDKWLRLFQMQILFSFSL